LTFDKNEIPEVLVKYDYSIKEPLENNTKFLEIEFKRIEQEVKKVDDHLNETNQNEKKLKSLIKTFKNESKNLLETIKIKSKEEERLKITQEEYKISTEDKRDYIQGILIRVDKIIKLNAELRTNKESESETEVIELRERHLRKIKDEIFEILSKKSDKDIKIETLAQSKESLSPTKKLDDTIYSLSDEAKNKSQNLKSEIDQHIYNFEQHLKQSHERDSFIHKFEEILEKLISELNKLTKEKEKKEKEVHILREEVSKLKWENELKQKKFFDEEEKFNNSQAKQIVFLTLVFVILISSYLFL
jgi:chromosome segregation ATPase